MNSQQKILFQEDQCFRLTQEKGIHFFQAEDGIRDPLWSRGLGDVYKRQV